MKFEMLRSMPDAKSEDPAFELRQRIYEGAIYLLPANLASTGFVATVLELIESELGNGFRKIHSQLDSDKFFEKIGRLRKLVYTSVEFHHQVNKVIESLGFNLGNQAYDPARMRVVAHDGHLNPAAAPIYFGHRDTWYSNHQAMITWWIPLHDVCADETFEFFPQEFDQPVENDSEVFDFDRWITGGQEKRIGWQKKETGRTAVYPSLLQTPQGEQIPVIAKAGEILMFSAQHLHQTRKNLTGKTRFSLDFRTVDLTDVKLGLEATNVDNRSTGSSLKEFVRPENKEGSSGLSTVQQSE